MAREKDEDEDYYLPVQDQRVFGAGIKRKRITFVPASTSESSLAIVNPSKSTSIGTRYLAIVLPKNAEETEDKNQISSDGGPGEAVPETCAVCKQPISTNDKITIDVHESSIAHQVCLEHSHPPSHLDREHVGLRYLETYGWDPDSRKGLGARQDGIRIPIKPKEKKDTTGLRETNDDDDKVSKKKAVSQKDDKIAKLNAKQVRLQELEAKAKTQKLRQSFYGPDLSRYLGPNS